MKNDPEAIYIFEQLTDNPLYEGFSFIREKSLRKKGDRLASDFFPLDLATKGRKWTIEKLAPIWTPQKVEGRVRAFNDSPWVDLTPAFSERAVKALRQFLEPNGELLPLTTSVGKYYAFNVTTIVDALDHKKSSVEWDEKEKITAFEIRRYEFQKKKIHGLKIFRLVENPWTFYVTQEFVDQVHKHQLNGFCFYPVWPLPKSMNWQKESKKIWLENQKLKSPKQDKPVKGNSIVLVFPLKGKSATSLERKSLEKIMDELDDILVQQKKNAPYYGSLEGDESVSNECRLFLSCPDATALVKKIMPWVKKVKWPKKIKIMKRLGEFRDPGAQEEWVM